MTYCSYADILAHTSTQLTQTVVEELIADADRKISAMLRAARLTPPSSDDTLRSASILLTKARVITAEVLNGTRANSHSSGGVSESHSYDRMIDTLEAQGEAHVATYIAEQQAADTQYDEGGERADASMPDFHLDQSEVPSFRGD